VISMDNPVDKLMQGMEMGHRLADRYDRAMALRQQKQNERDDIYINEFGPAVHDPTWQRDTDLATQQVTLAKLQQAEQRRLGQIKTTSLPDMSATILADLQQSAQTDATNGTSWDVVYPRFEAKYGKRALDKFTFDTKNSLNVARMQMQQAGKLGAGDDKQQPPVTPGANGEPITKIDFYDFGFKTYEDYRKPRPLNPKEASAELNDMYNFAIKNPELVTEAMKNDMHQYRKWAGMIDANAPIDDEFYNFARRAREAESNKNKYLTNKIKFYREANSEEGRQQVIQDILNDPNAPEGAAEFVQSFSPTSYKDAAAEEHKDIAELDRFIVNTRKWIKDAYQSPANPDTIDYDTLSTRQALWQAQQIRENPGTTAKDYPKENMPSGFGRSGDMTAYQNKSLGIREQAASQRAYEWQANQQWKAKNYDLALEKLNISKSKSEGKADEEEVRQIGQSQVDALRMLGFGSAAIKQAPQEVLRLYGYLLRNDEVTKGGWKTDPQTNERKYIAPQMTQKAKDKIDAITKKYNGTSPSTIPSAAPSKAKAEKYSGPDYGKNGCAAYVKSKLGYGTKSLSSLPIKGKGPNAEVRPGNAIHLKADPDWVFVNPDGKTVSEWVTPKNGKPHERTNRTVASLRSRIIAVHAKPTAIKSSKKKVSSSKARAIKGVVGL
jgi:hypothetical protein